MGYAWRWVQVEAAAGLARRGARASDWRRLDELLAALLWIDLPPEHIQQLAALNRKWHLRAADAGHIYCFQQASVIAGLVGRP
ncbi:MAG: hypothetical protein JXB04_04680 [Kiritimatiellae bacterium]|nr:hypothetical protein [Kiritimatiellia bacterium]